jgi:exodeoxyribonuclease V alpha subunit
MKDLRAKFEPLIREGYLSYIDLHLAQLCAEMEKDAKKQEAVFLAALAASRGAREKDVCFPLDGAVGGEYPEADDCAGLMDLPDADKWEKTLLSSLSVGSPGDYKPLILENRRLYLQKYWYYETLCATKLAASAVMNGDLSSAADAVNALFPEKDGAIDWQKCAAGNALLRRFSVVTGGPGTGKTTTAARILLLLASIHGAGDSPLRIALCAPTGKAAALLHGSIRTAIERLESESADSPEIQKILRAGKVSVPAKSYTIHRLLGSLPDSPHFKHNASNPLPYDLIIADEMSMADISLAARLVDAVGPSARLIFLGDRDQLSSVEAGSVMGDICDNGDEPQYTKELASVMKKIGIAIPLTMQNPRSGGMRGAVVYLAESRRFTSESGIGRAAHLVNTARNQDDAVELYRSITMGACGGVSWREYLSKASASDSARDSALMNILSDVTTIEGHFPYDWYGTAFSPEESLEKMKNFQILCALKRGGFGSENINRLIPQILKQKGLLRPEGRIYHGLPVMVTQNDHAMRLYNGDVGIALSDGTSIRVYFKDAEKGTIRSVSPYQLPSWDSAWALTVHKSQGSEYENVLLVLPWNDSPVVTRELVYTAITRAKKSCHIAGRGTVFCESVSRRVQRRSGLRERLWG